MTMHNRMLQVLIGPFLGGVNNRLVPLAAHSRDLSGTVNVWSMIAERLTYHYKLVTNVD